MNETTDTPTSAAIPETDAATTETAAATVAETPASATQGVQQTSSDGEDKPYLGGPAGGPNADEAPKEDEPRADAPKPATEADYLAKVVKDEQLLGTDKNVQLDGDLIRAMVPTAQELGVSPETLGKLANALAKAQLDAGREAQRGRIEYFNRMKEESVKRYSPTDFQQINAGIDHWFKPNGVMNNVIRTSELGADPEFLALMHHLGSKRAMDSLNGATEGGGGSSVDPNSTEGLSKIW